MTLLLDCFGYWLRRHVKAALIVMLVPAVISLATDHFSDGQTAYYAGNIQFIALVLFLLYARALLLFMPYGATPARILHRLFHGGAQTIPVHQHCCSCSSALSLRLSGCQPAWANIASMKLNPAKQQKAL